MVTCQHPIVAVRAIVVSDDGRVLIVQRNGQLSSPRGWSLPGGKLDYCETLEDGVRRELREEVSLEVGNVQFLFCQDSLPFEPGGMHCLNVYFECRPLGDVALDQESVAHAWIRREDLARYAMVFRNDIGLQMYWDRVGAP